MKLRAYTCVLVTLVLIANVSQAADSLSSNNKIRPRLSTNQVENQIELDKKANPLYESKLLAPIKEWENSVVLD